AGIGRDRGLEFGASARDEGWAREARKRLDHDRIIGRAWLPTNQHDAWSSNCVARWAALVSFRRGGGGHNEIAGEGGRTGPSRGGARLLRPERGEAIAAGVAVPMGGLHGSSVSCRLRESLQ